MPTITTETRKRGLFGWIVAILFWGWNAIMGWSFIGGLGATGEGYKSAATNGQQTAYTIGSTIGFGLILMLWMFGAVILGLMMMFTRGKTTLVTREA